MRMTDRLRATCSTVATAALCTVVINTMIMGAAIIFPVDAQAAPLANRDAARSANLAPPRAGTTLRVSMPHLSATQPSATQTAATLRAAQKLRGAVGAPTSKSGNIKSGKLRVAGTALQQNWGGISCVPFARAATGLDVKGNAHAWWDSAAGSYERGQRPEAGSVLNFRATGRMRLGHVAVVARVVDNRTIEIDHANWAGPGGGKGQVARGVPVIDVSEGNDWSAVQVGLGGGGFGSVYPTFGFIYDRPDRGIMLANTTARPSARQTGIRYSEVAEAWSARVSQPSAARGFIDAPPRSLR